jgi:hypothetical protein
MRWLATAFKSEAKASHSKAGVNACIKALIMVREGDKHFIFNAIDAKCK